MGKDILVVSDTHGINTNLRIALERERGHFDMVFHLGDFGGNEDAIIAMTDCPVVFVRGNCDGWSKLPSELNFTESGHHFFLTHGHRYFVGYDRSTLAEEAARLGADVALYGHTHVACCEMIDDILVINPGSLSRPRGYNYGPSYAMLHVEPFEQVTCEIKTITDK